MFGVLKARCTSVKKCFRSRACPLGNTTALDTIFTPGISVEKISGQSWLVCTSYLPEGTGLEEEAGQMYLQTDPPEAKPSKRLKKSRKKADNFPVSGNTVSK